VDNSRSPALDTGRRKAVLIFAYYYPPQVTSGAMRPARFVKYLPQFGYSPVVVSARLPFVSESDAPVCRVPVEKPSRTVKFASGVAKAIERILPYGEHLPWVPHAVDQAARLHSATPFAAVISTSPPAGTHLAALLMKGRFGIRWIADFRDPLLGNPFRQRRMARHYDMMLERLIIKNADAVVANTQPLADIWRQRYPQWRNKFTTIWNGYDPEDGLESGPLPQRDCRTLMHIGSLYAARHPGKVLLSLQRLIGRSALDPSTLHVRFVGPMEDVAVPLDSDHYRPLRECGCVEYDGITVAPEKAMRCMVDADFLLLLDINEHNSGLQVPAKLFDYIRTGRPILAVTTERSAVEHILSKSGVPYQCVYNTASDDETDRRIQQFLETAHELAAPNAWFLNQFNGIAQSRTLASLVTGLPAWSESVQ